jgi:hypothetical protein
MAVRTAGDGRINLLPDNDWVAEAEAVDEEQRRQQEAVETTTADSSMLDGPTVGMAGTGGGDSHGWEASGGHLDPDEWEKPEGAYSGHTQDQMNDFSGGKT